MRRWPGQVGMGATMAMTAAWEGKKIVVGVVESRQAPTTAELRQNPTTPRLRVRRRLQLLARQGKTSASRLQRNGYYKQLQKYSIARFDRAISGLSVSLLALALLIIRFGQRKGRFVHHLYAFTFLFLPLPLLFFLDLALVVALLL